MEAMSATALIKAVAEYGVLGMGWIAWIVTMFYVQTERKRYQGLVIHIIEYFTKIRLSERNDNVEPILGQGLDQQHLGTFKRLFGQQSDSLQNEKAQGESAGSGKAGGTRSD